MMSLISTAVPAATADGNEFYFFLGLILCAAAFLLFMVEIFIPSGGLIAALCGLVAIASIVVMLQYSVTAGILMIVFYCIAAPIVLVFGLKMWARSPFAHKLILKEKDEQLDMSPTDAVYQSESRRRDRVDELKGYIGREGVTISALRPVGFVRIDGQQIDAMAENGIIEANSPVEVVDAYDNQLKVRPTEGN